MVDTYAIIEVHNVLLQLFVPQFYIVFIYICGK